MTGGPRHVELRGIDLACWQRWSEHHGSLVREAALIAGSDPTDRAQVPSRLVSLVDRLHDEYGGPMSTVDSRQRAAIDAGHATLDLDLEVPARVAVSCQALCDMLDEIDEHCAAGDMLTVPPSPQVVEFRRWYLLQFVHQIEGRPPVPWPQWRDAHLHADR